MPVRAQAPPPGRSAVAVIDLPFAATHVTMSADGDRAAVWDVPRTQADSQSLAVIDLRRHKLVAQTILQSPLLDVVVGKDIFILDNKSISRLSADRLEPQAVFEYTGGPGQFQIRYDQPPRLVLVADDRLSLARDQLDLPDLTLALPDLTLIEHYDFGMRMAAGWFDGRCAFGWLWDGVLWDDSMSKPLLLAWTREFKRAPFDQAPRLLRDPRPSPGTWHPFPNKATRPPERKVLTTATSPDIATTLGVVEDVAGYHLASFRLDDGKFIASVQLAPSNTAAKNVPRGGITVTGGDRFAVLLLGRLYTGALKNLRGDNSLPFHILPRQSTFVLANDKPTTVRYEAARATRFRISSQILGSPDKPFEATSETGEFTLSVSEALDKLSNTAGQGSLYAGPLRSAFLRLFGREANGIPLPIDIEVTAYGTDFETAILRHDFLVEVPLQYFEEPPDRKDPSAQSPWKKPAEEFDLTTYSASASPPSGREAWCDYLRGLWATPHPKLTGEALRDAARQAKAAGDKLLHDRFVKWLADKQWRTWTDVDGRQAEALLVQYFAGQATLRTRQGAEVTVDETKLSKADREFLQGTTEPVTPNDSDAWREFVFAEAGRAVNQFHTARNMFPPRALTDDAGQPRLSWRVLLLGELGYSELFALFRFDEPWNSAHNLALIPFMPNVYAVDAAAAKSDTTTVVTVFSPLSALPTSGVTGLSSFGVEAPATIIFVEAAASRATQWTKPFDLQLYEFTDPSAVVRARHDKVLVALLSGQTLQIPADTSSDNWRFAVNRGDARRVLGTPAP